MAIQKQIIRPQFLIKIMMAFALSLGLAACQTTDGKIETTASVVPETPVETGPEYIDGLGYHMTWEKTDASLVMAPQDIKDEVLALCQEKGFVRFFMRKISFSTHQAEGYFDCTGANSN